MALIIPIENIDLTELRRRTGDRRRAALTRQGFAPDVQDFIPPVPPAPPLPLEPERVPERVPGRAPAPRQAQQPFRGAGTSVSQAIAAPVPGDEPAAPIDRTVPQPRPFTDIPPETSEDKIQALLAAGIVAPPEEAETLPLGSIAVPQPNPVNLDTLLIKRELGADTGELEVEAQRQAEVRRAEGPTFGEAGEALEHTIQPLDVLAQTAGQTVAQVPKLFKGDLDELEAPTLFNSGLNLVEGFRNARDEFRERPVGEQIGLGLLFDPTILVPFLKPARILATTSRLTTKGAVATRGAFQVERALAAGVPGLPVSPPPQSLVAGLEAKMARLRELQEFGLTLDASANEFAAPLRSMDQRIGEVITSDHPLLRVILGDSGINPAIKRNTTVGRAGTAYQMGRIEAEELISVTLAAGYDFHFAQGLQGRLGRVAHLLPIDRKTGFFGDTGKVWQDVFSKPGDFDLSPAQRALIDDYNQVSNFEIPRILEDVGITQRMRSRPEGEYYVFRDVQEIRDIEIRRHSNPNLQRHYDSATSQ